MDQDEIKHHSQIVSVRIINSFKVTTSFRGVIILLCLFNLIPVDMIHGRFHLLHILLVNIPAVLKVKVPDGGANLKARSKACQQTSLGVVSEADTFEPQTTKMRCKSVTGSADSIVFSVPSARTSMSSGENACRK